MTWQQPKAYITSGYFVLWHDNNTKHVPFLVKNYLQDTKVNIIDQHAQNWDLIPIENLSGEGQHPCQNKSERFDKEWLKLYLKILKATPNSWRLLFSNKDAQLTFSIQANNFEFGIFWVLQINFVSECKVK